MGWSYRSDAGRTMDAIEAACKQTREPHGETCSNTFFVGGKRYFYETSRRDQVDGGIAGTIYRCLPNEMCRRVGTFRISGDGRVVRGPKLFRRARPVSTGRWS